jgi:hypothetical protein
MIPVNVLSGPILAVSEGYRPAHSRSADPTRAYEPGSGDSHDHAPARRPHPPRPPPHQGRSRRPGSGYAAAPPAPRLLRTACGGGLRPALTPETTAAAAAGNAGRPEPAPCRRRPAGNSPPRSLPGITTGRPGCHASNFTRRNAHSGTNKGIRLADVVQKLDRPFHMNISGQCGLIRQRVGEQARPHPGPGEFSRQQQTKSWTTGLVSAVGGQATPTWLGLMPVTGR